MSKGRPGGNPQITEFSFSQQHQWSQPCAEAKTLRMPADMKIAISQHLPQWQEVCRQAIASQLPAEVAAELGWPFDEKADNGSAVKSSG